MIWDISLWEYNFIIIDNSAFIERTNEILTWWRFRTANQVGRTANWHSDLVGSFLQLPSVNWGFHDCTSTDIPYNPREPNCNEILFLGSICSNGRFLLSNRQNLRQKTTGNAERNNRTQEEICLVTSVKNTIIALGCATPNVYYRIWNLLYKLQELNLTFVERGGALFHPGQPVIW